MAASKLSPDGSHYADGPHLDLLQSPELDPAYESEGPNRACRHFKRECLMHIATLLVQIKRAACKVSPIERYSLLDSKPVDLHVEQAQTLLPIQKDCSSFKHLHTT